MILQALTAYYDRMEKRPPLGYASKPVSFCLTLNPDGSLFAIDDLRTAEGKGRPLQVPDIGQKRSVNIQPNLACDNCSYVLGIDSKGTPQGARERFESFRVLHQRLAKDVHNETTEAVAAFLKNWDPAKSDSLQHREEILAGGNLVFRLRNCKQYLHDIPEVAAWWWKYLSSPSRISGQCLITGRTAPIVELHPAVKGVKGTDASGAGIVNFNCDAFESYGKTQCLNAPVSIEAAFRYTAALNDLLQRNSRQKVLVGTRTIVFWTEKPEPVETIFPHVFDDQSQDTDTLQRIATLLEAVKKGDYPSALGNPETRFYILGLSGNGPRIVVRLWLVSTVEQIVKTLAQHFEDLRIDGKQDKREYPSLDRLLRELAVDKDRAKIPSHLAESVTRAVLTGTLYPHALLQNLLSRIRAESGDVNYLRACLIKAYLNRLFRTQPNRKEVPVALDVSRSEIPYLLGRLFAVLEKVQVDALGKPDISITDRFYASASSTPVVAFPRLLRLSQYHLAKLDEGRRIVRERLIQQIMDGIEKFPSHLTLDEQGLFAIGYYHQKRAFYTSTGRKEVSQ